MNEYRKLMESIDTIDAKGSQFDEDYNPMQTDEVPPAPQTDPMDLVTMDVPLLIRLFELMKETVQDDAELHHITTQILNVSKQSDEPLTMEKYNEILNGQSDEPVEEGFGMGMFNKKKPTRFDVSYSYKVGPPRADSKDQLGYLTVNASDSKEAKSKVEGWLKKKGHDTAIVTGIKPVNESVNEEFTDNRGEFIVMPLPGLMGSPVTGWREMQKYFNGKTPLYVRADSGVDGLIISHNPVDNDMLAKATEQEGLWK